MADLRLQRLADRAPVKIAISVSPELNQALLDYAALYQQTYGTAEPLHQLIPAMLANFLASDRAFVRRRSSETSGR